MFPGSRIIVHNDIKDKFEAALIERKNIKLGNGFDETTEMGPVISAEHRTKIETTWKLLKMRTQQLRLVVTSEREDLQDGFFFEPTVITNCDTSMRIVQEEVFGPVVTIEGHRSRSNPISE